VIAVVQSNRLEEREVIGGDQFRDKILAAAHGLRMKLGFSENPKLAERFLTAGLRGKSASDMFFAAQFLVPILGLIAGSFIPDNTIFWCFALAVIGYMSPDFWLTWKTNKRKKKIQRSMPDAIDLLVICVDAGLGLDQACLRVGEELAISHPEINQEFSQVNLAQRAGQPRLEAWKNLAERTRIDEFLQFVSMLNQTERFGTPIAKALARFSEELRTRRRQKAEEAATKTKIKIIFPLVLFIFPCIFIVLLAPAILSIIQGFKSMGN
jgi:tight adherence protein C